MKRGVYIKIAFVPGSNVTAGLVNSMRSNRSHYTRWRLHTFNFIALKVKQENRDYKRLCQWFDKYRNQNISVLF